MGDIYSKSYWLFYALLIYCFYVNIVTTAMFLFIEIHREQLNDFKSFLSIAGYTRLFNNIKILDFEYDHRLSLLDKRSPYATNNQLKKQNICT